MRVILVVAALAIPWFAADMLDAVTLAAVTIGGIVLAGIVSAIPARKLRNLRVVEVVASSMFILHWIGQAVNAYNHYAYYDTALHAVGGLAGGLVAYELLTATTWLADPETLTPGRTFYLAFSIILLSGIAVELVEYGSDVSLGSEAQGSPVQGPHDDTMTDLVAEVVTGAISSGMAAWAVARRGSAVEHVQDPAVIEGARSRRGRTS